MTDDLLTTDQAAEQLGVTPAYVVRLAERAGIALVRIGPNTRGGQWLIWAADVAELRRRREEAPPARGRPRAAQPTAAADAQRRRRARLAEELAEPPAEELTDPS